MTGHSSLYAPARAGLRVRPPTPPHGTGQLPEETRQAMEVQFSRRIPSDIEGTTGPRLVCSLAPLHMPGQAVATVNCSNRDHATLAAGHSKPTGCTTSAWSWLSSQRRWLDTYHVPWHHAAQVSADGVQAVLLDGVVLSDDEVCGIGLQVGRPQGCHHLTQDTRAVQAA